MSRTRRAGGGRDVPDLGPAALPGERLTEPVLHYLRTGAAAGMHLPDAADPTLETVRVLAE